MKPAWDRLGDDYHGHKKVVVADVDCTQHQGLCGKHGVQGYPTIKYYTDEYPDGTAYNGGRDFDALKKFVEETLNTGPSCSPEAKESCDPEDLKILEESEAMSKKERNAKLREMKESIKAKTQRAKELEEEVKALEDELDLIKLGGIRPPQVEQLLNHGEFSDFCETGVCIIAFVPHILDSGAETRNQELKILNDAMKENKDLPLTYLWSQGGDQYEAEEKLQLAFGFPAVIAVHLQKERFGIHRGTFEGSSIKDFAKSLMLGRVPLNPWPKNLKFSKADPWDGKDGQLPDEEY